MAMDTTRDLRHRRLHSAACSQKLRSAIIPIGTGQDYNYGT